MRYYGNFLTKTLYFKILKMTLMPVYIPSNPKNTNSYYKTITKWNRYFFNVSYRILLKTKTFLRPTRTHNILRNFNPAKFLDSFRKRRNLRTSTHLGDEFFTLWQILFILTEFFNTTPDETRGARSRGPLVFDNPCFGRYKSRRFVSCDKALRFFSGAHPPSGALRPPGYRRRGMLRFMQIVSNRSRPRGVNTLFTRLDVFVLFLFFMCSSDEWLISALNVFCSLGMEIVVVIRRVG